MNEIEISPVRLDEAEAVVDLAGRVWRAHYPGIITPEQIETMLAQRYRPVLVRQFLARGDIWLAARVAGALAGFAHGHPLTEDDYKLDKLYVDLDWQRQGIGGRLIDALAARIVSQGFSRLVLRVNRQNQNGIHAYLKHGFTVTTIHLEDIGNGFIMDDYVMTRELT
ncbi:MAG: GNAT family N-acetyltransferase [Pseudomonadota bacterium]|nr:GNAT family N-acetyltransferase [Pseudomonadota bacterium]